MVTKLDRLARSLARSPADAHDIADELTTKGVALNLGGSVHDPFDPVGGPPLNALGMIAEFESDLIRMRTRKGLAVTRAAGKPGGKQPKPSPRQQAHLTALHATEQHTPTNLAHLFEVGRSTIYRTLTRTSQSNHEDVSTRTS